MSAKRKRLYIILAIVSMWTVYICFRFQSSYLVYCSVGRDLSGQYQIYRRNKVLVITKDNIRCFEVTARGFAYELNRPLGRYAGFLVFDADTYDGKPIYEYDSNAKPTHVTSGYWEAWVGDDRQHEIVRIPLR